MIERVGRWAVPVLAVLGLADAAYLTVLDLTGEIPPCAGYAGCGQVNTSAYAHLFGVPVAALGTTLYVAILAVALWRGRLVGLAWGQGTLALYALVLAGALFMAYLTAVELFVLHAICYWCVALATITLILLILTTRDLWRFSTGRAVSLP